MSILRLSIRERTILMFFIIVCGVGAANVFICRPAVRERERLQGAIESAQKRIAEQSRVIARDKQMPDTFRQKLDSKLQKAADPEVFSGILSEIENAARALNIRVVEMKPLAVVPDKLMNKFPVNVSADAGLKELIAFIHSLQAPEHDLDIAQFSLERPFGESAHLQAKIVIVRSLIRTAENQQVKPGRTSAVHPPDINEGQ